ncbi:MAG: MFS transporter [Aestuariivirga sp.]|uniref:MFS transporter n=1 Tax=Aestuariivirga sp. TaxID=2650926 RepID=UPI0025C16548|nr:MFS transporter [Aestuariivirga sp.]MCA3560008.1 MFS transporter [Aestuariivirga sp.]
MSMHPHDQNPTVLQVLKGTSLTVRFLLAGAFINQLGYFIQAYIIVFMVARGFDTLQAGWGLATFSAGSILGTLLAAPLAARIGDRSTIMLASLCTALFVAMIPIGVRPDLPVFAWAGSIALAGVFAQMYRPAAANILSHHFRQDLQVMGFSMLRIALNLGGAVGPVVATALAAWNWDLVFGFNAFTSLLFAGMAAAFIRDPRPATGDARDDVGTPSATSAWSHLMRDGRFIAFLGAMFLSSIVFAQFYATVPIGIEAQGMPLKVYSTLLSTYAVVLILCELKISSIVRRYPVWKPAALGTTVLCLGVASFGLTLHSAAGQMASTVLLVGGLIISGPTMFAYPARFPLAVRRLYISANQAAFSAGLAIGPIVGIAIFNSHSGLIWLICLALALISGMLCVVGMRAPADTLPAAPDAAGASGSGG